ncbi:hypothetical protein IWW37_002307 [Coemansia sp. RSA 2050]|nr:hypothetical protein IWW37_002307 [Coemansia sp. RSA 2050]KAJ2734499.1 hypothetical protein IW152_002277 [Coemansia sp. BCRC 34962]
MFTSFQDALKKLREVKQVESSQLKRHAVAETPSAPPEDASASADLGDPEFDLGDVDVFDDLLVGDMDIGNEPPSVAQPQPPPIKPTATPTATSPVSPAAASKSASRLAAFAFSKPVERNVGEQQQQPSIILQTPSEPQQVSSSQESSRFQLLKMPSQQSDSKVPGESQVTGNSDTQRQDSLATPRPGSDGSKASGKVSDFVTIVVNSAKRGLSSADHQHHQEIPGPAGLVGAPIPNAVVPTQKPTSTYNTVLSLQAKSEQPTDIDFESGTWAAMIDHLGMPSYGPLTANAVTRTEERAAWPICRVLRLLHTQKVPSMLVQIRHITGSESDASAIVVDPTGEMRASIHHTVVHRVAIPLVAGTSIILSGVAAMKMPGWPPFIVITGGMIEQIFAVESAGTHEDPIVVEDTQKGAVFSSTLALRTAAGGDSEGAIDMQATQNSGVSTVIATQSAVDLGVDEFDDMPEETDDLLSVLNNEPLFGDGDDDDIGSLF